MSNTTHNKYNENMLEANEVHPAQPFLAAPEFKLTPEEKDQIRVHLKEFMVTHPVPNTTETSSEKPALLISIGKYVRNAISVASPYMKNMENKFPTFMHVTRNKLVYTIGLCFLVLSLVTTTVSAAQDALPGDLLYSIKIQLNERAERTLALDAEAKAEIAVRQAATRLEEANKLIAKNKFDRETQALVHAQFVHNSTILESQVVKLEREGRAETAIQISTKFEDTMRDYEHKIENSLQYATEGAKKELETVQKTIQARKALSATTRAELEKELDASSTLLRIKESSIKELDSSNRKLEYTERYAENSIRNNQIPENDKADLNKDLEEVRQAVAQGKSKWDVGAYSDAFQLFRHASKKADAIGKKIRNGDTVQTAKKYSTGTTPATTSVAQEPVKNSSGLPGTVQNTVTTAVTATTSSTTGTSIEATQATQTSTHAPAATSILETVTPTLQNTETVLPTTNTSSGVLKGLGL